jgi:hypothetical protein
MLADLGTIVTPETLLAWYSRLIVRTPLSGRAGVIAATMCTPGPRYTAACLDFGDASPTNGYRIPPNRRPNGAYGGRFRPIRAVIRRRIRRTRTTPVAHASDEAVQPPQ